MVSMLEESHVQIHVHADDWEDATRKAGNVLVTAESIDASYIEHMIQSVKTLCNHAWLCTGSRSPLRSCEKK